MGRLSVTIKRNKAHVDLYYRGEKLVTLEVDESNRSVASVISLTAKDEVSYKIVKQDNYPKELDDNYFNKEHFNK